MAEERVKRKLAANVSADVVGWSRLMGDDEAGTLATLKRHREELIDPKIEEFGGRIVSTAGDSVLVEYPSAVDAVKCSIEIQDAIAERNAGLSGNEQMLFRVGVNLGEVIIDGDDVFGDGVNVAARLQALAKPGGVSISGEVHRQVQGKLGVAFNDLGEQHVKNIAQPVHVYAVNTRSAAKVAANTATDALPAVPSRPSIAVLPFDNMSDDPNQEYLADGIAEDITTELSRYSDLFVIARNSAFAFKGQATDLHRIAKELGVRYLLEGSVRRISDRI